MRQDYGIFRLIPGFSVPGASLVNEQRVARFTVGTVVRHRLFGYRGVIYDVDPVFQGTAEWYEHMARSRPPKDAPWYHVLVHAQGYETYVAERNLEPDASGQPVEHPHVARLFESFGDGCYRRRLTQN